MRFNIMNGDVIVNTVEANEEYGKKMGWVLAEKPNNTKTREWQYQNNPCILWSGEYITVDKANQLCLSYFVEVNDKSDELKTLIISAKENIRRLYP